MEEIFTIMNFPKFAEIIPEFVFKLINTVNIFDNDYNNYLNRLSEAVVDNNNNNNIYKSWQKKIIRTGWSHTH